MTLGGEAMVVAFTPTGMTDGYEQGWADGAENGGFTVSLNGNTGTATGNGDSSS